MKESPAIRVGVVPGAALETVGDTPAGTDETELGELGALEGGGGGAVP